MKTSDGDAVFWLEPSAKGRSYCVAVMSRKLCGRNEDTHAYDVQVEVWEDRGPDREAEEVNSVEGTAKTWAEGLRLGRRLADAFELGYQKAAKKKRRKKR